MRLLAALLALLLFAGCARVETPLPEATQAPQDPGSPTEQQTGETPEVFPTQYRGDFRLEAFGNSLLLCSNGESILYPPGQASTTLRGIPILSREDKLWLCDGEAGVLRILDEALTETEILPLPEGMLGLPDVCPEGNTLYFLKSDGLYLLERDTGISRVLRDNMAVATGSVEALADGLTLLLRLTDPNGETNTLLLSARDGSALEEDYLPLDAAWCGAGMMLLSLENGFQKLLLLDGNGQTRQLLVGAEEGLACFLPEIEALVTWEATGNSGITARLYSLSTGLLESSVSLPDFEALGGGCVTRDGRLFLSARNPDGQWSLLRWNYHASPPENSRSFFVPFSQADPAQEAACRESAGKLWDAYGIRVRVLQEAADVEPWDYSLTPSDRTDETLWALETAGRILSCFPEGFLSQLQDKRLSLCFVESIRGRDQTGSLLQAKGLQFEQDQESYLVLALAPARELRYTLVHELSHLIDSQVLRFSDAYDSWNDLNPQEFSYSLDVNADMGQFRGLLEGDTRCFVDEYAMTYPAEDRARILEYAMNPGNEALFRPPVLQQKLQRICTGIRQAFGLTAVDGAFLWEQYLTQDPGGT